MLGAGAGGKATQVQEAMDTFNQSQPSAPASRPFRNPSGSSVPKNSLPRSPTAIVSGQPMVQPDADAPIGSLKAASSSSFNPAAAVESARKAAESLGPMSDLTRNFALDGHLHSSEDDEPEQASDKPSDRQR